MELITERLMIQPMQTSELELFIENEQSLSPELQTAYGEMAEGCRNHLREQLWYTLWKISRKDDGKVVGSACFKGLVNGHTEIGYGIHPECENRGYATEAVTELCKWAMSQNGVLYIEAETEKENLSSKRVLKKVGFAAVTTREVDSCKFIFMTKGLGMINS